MKKLIETLFTTANNRVRSPLIGSFIFSWIIFNWKPISYFLFSGEKTKDKIFFIESNYENIGNAIFYPLIFSSIYVLFLPYLNQYIQSLTLKAEKSKRKKQHELDIENIEYSQESAEKEKVLEDIRSGNRDIAQLNEKILKLEENNLRLKDTIQNKDEIIGDYGEQLDKVTSDLQISNRKLAEEKRDRNIDNDTKPPRNFAKTIFNYLTNRNLIGGLETLREYLMTGTKLPNNEVSDDLLKDFLEMGIISKSENSPSGFLFSPLGREILSYHLIKRDS